MPVIFEDDHLQVIYAPGGSVFSVATFGTRDDKSNGRDFWGQTLSLNYDIECFGFVAKAPNWYPVASISNSLVAISPFLRSPLIGYGHSMGGYAALKYSKFFGFLGTVSSGPQISIDPDDVPNDSRYSHHFDSTLNRDMRIRCDDIGGRAIVVYDPTFMEDRYHVDMITSLSDKVEVLALRYMHHRTAQALRPSSVLIPMFEEIVQGRHLVSWNRAARKNRRNSIEHFIYLARALLGRSKPRLALQILDTIGRKPSQSHNLEISLYRARAYAKLGEFGTARALFEKMLDWDPGYVVAQMELERIKHLR